MSSHPNTFFQKNQGGLALRQTRQRSQDENSIKMNLVNKNIPVDENKENVSKNILIDQKYVRFLTIKIYLFFNF